MKFELRKRKKARPWWMAGDTDEDPLAKQESEDMTLGSEERSMSLGPSARRGKTAKAPAKRKPKKSATGNRKKKTKKRDKFEMHTSDFEVTNPSDWQTTVTDTDEKLARARAKARPKGRPKPKPTVAPTPRPRTPKPTPSPTQRPPLRISALSTTHRKPIDETVSFEEDNNRGSPPPAQATKSSEHHQGDKAEGSNVDGSPGEPDGDKAGSAEMGPAPLASQPTPDGFTALFEYIDRAVGLKMRELNINASRSLPAGSAKRSAGEKANGGANETSGGPEKEPAHAAANVEGGKGRSLSETIAQRLVLWGEQGERALAHERAEKAEAVAEGGQAEEYRCSDCGAMFWLRGHPGVVQCVLCDGHAASPRALAASEPGRQPPVHISPFFKQLHQNQVDQKKAGDGILAPTGSAEKGVEVAPPFAPVYELKPSPDPLLRIEAKEVSRDGDAELAMEVDGGLRVEEDKLDGRLDFDNIGQQGSPAQTQGPVDAVPLSVAERETGATRAPTPLSMKEILMGALKERRENAATGESRQGTQADDNSPPKPPPPPHASFDSSFVPSPSSQNNTKISEILQQKVDFEQPPESGAPPSGAREETAGGGPHTTRDGTQKAIEQAAITLGRLREMGEMMQKNLEETAKRAVREAAAETAKELFKIHATKGGDAGKSDGVHQSLASHAPRREATVSVTTAPIMMNEEDQYPVTDSGTQPASHGLESQAPVSENFEEYEEEEETEEERRREEREKREEIRMQTEAEKEKTRQELNSLAGSLSRCAREVNSTQVRINQLLETQALELKRKERQREVVRAAVRRLMMAKRAKSVAEREKGLEEGEDGESEKEALVQQLRRIHLAVRRVEERRDAALSEGSDGGGASSGAGSGNSGGVGGWFERLANQIDDAKDHLKELVEQRAELVKRLRMKAILFGELARRHLALTKNYEPPSPPKRVRRRKKKRRDPSAKSSRRDRSAVGAPVSFVYPVSPSVRAVRQRIRPMESPSPTREPFPSLEESPAAADHKRYKQQYNKQTERTRRNKADSPETVSQMTQHRKGETADSKTEREEHLRAPTMAARSPISYRTPPHRGPYSHSVTPPEWVCRWLEPSGPQMSRLYALASPYSTNAHYGGTARGFVAEPSNQQWKQLQLQQQEREKNPGAETPRGIWSLLREPFAWRDLMSRTRTPSGTGTSTDPTEKQTSVPRTGRATPRREESSNVLTPTSGEKDENEQPLDVLRRRVSRLRDAHVEKLERQERKKHSDRKSSGLHHHRSRENR